MSGLSVVFSCNHKELRLLIYILVHICLPSYFTCNGNSCFEFPPARKFGCHVYIQLAVDTLYNTVPSTCVCNGSICQQFWIETKHTPSPILQTVAVMLIQMSSLMPTMSWRAEHGWPVSLRVWASLWLRRTLTISRRMQNFLKKMIFLVKETSLGSHKMILKLCVMYTLSTHWHSSTHIHTHTHTHTHTHK